MTCSSCRRRRISETAAEAIFKGVCSGPILAFDIAAAGPSIRELIGKTEIAHGLRVPALIHRRGTFLHESSRYTRKAVGENWSGLVAIENSALRQALKSQQAFVCP